MQVDWGEAVVYIDGEKQTINLFCARLCSSCAPVVLAYRRQNEESFLDAFVRTFNAFGGVPEKVIFDNGKVAVKDGFGANARKQAGYTALCAHYGFDALFCNPAEGHEKGLVEGLVGWARRNIMVPVPHVDSITRLNAMLRERCHEYEGHCIKGKPGTVGKMLAEEKAALRPLPLYPFETAKCSNVRVSTFSTVRFATNDSTELAEARDNYVLGKLEKRIRQADLLILDEMSYVSFDRFQSELLFKVISDRSERGSVIVTTNLAFSQWTELFGNTAMVAALVDRLTFKSFVLDMNGDSYQLEQTMKSHI